MLDIIVNGQRIAIERGTSIQVEFNSSIFSTDGIEGDVAYSFDVPAAPNDLIFESARFVYVQRRRKYACAILLAGTPIGNGNLYVTKATKDTYSCELAVNAFPDGWRDRKLRDNDYGDDIIISDNYAEHRQNWLKFLQSTLSDDSIIKFPLFLDEDYYDDNEDFGYWEGQANDPIGEKANNGVVICKFVNRLSFYFNGNDKDIEDAPPTSVGSYSSVHSGWRLFNELHAMGENNVEYNQLSFAPALKIRWLLEKVIANAQYSLKGNFVGSGEVGNLFYQSLHSMDGTLNEYYPDPHVNAEGNSGNFPQNNYTGSRVIPVVMDDLNSNIGSFDNTTHRFVVPIEGTYNFSVTIRFRKEIGFFVTDAQSFGTCLRFLMGSPGHTDGCNLLSEGGVGQYESIVADDCVFDAPIGATGMPNVYGDKIRYKGSNMGGDVWELQISFTHTFLQKDVDKPFEFVLQDARLLPLNGQAFSEARDWIMTEDYTTGTGPACEMDLSYDYYANSLKTNIFTNKLKFSDHVPDKTNSEFLKSLQCLYGLSFFIDSLSKEIEISFIKDIFTSGQIDLTHYEMDDETSFNGWEYHRYVYELPPVESNEVADDDLLEDNEYMSTLPVAADNVGKKTYIRSLNEIYSAQRVEDAITVWSYIWERYSGNALTLPVGESDMGDDDTRVTVGVEIPSKQFTFFSPDVGTDYIVDAEHPSGVPYVPEIDSVEAQLHYPSIKAQAVSFLNETNSGFDLILLRYLGDEEIPPHMRYHHNVSNPLIIGTLAVEDWDNGPHYYHHFSPVCYGNDNARIPGNDLTATGEHSIGEVYVKPWLQLLSNYEKITYRFLLPPAKLLEVIRLFRPQDAVPENQVRWIFVENVRVLPIRMTFEIVEGKDQILTEIECAKPVV